MPPEAREAIRAEFGLDKSLCTEYGVYLKEMVKGNLGLGFRTHEPVLDKVLEKVGNTVPMVGLGAIVAILIGL